MTLGLRTLMARSKNPWSRWQSQPLRRAARFPRGRSDQGLLGDAKKQQKRIVLDIILTPKNSKPTMNIGLVFHLVFVCPIQ